MKLHKLIWLFAGCLLVISACAVPAGQAFLHVPQAASASINTPEARVLPAGVYGGGATDNLIIYRQATPTQAAPTETPDEPGDTPGNINPLTGLPVNNAQNLLLPPALVTITNWPPSARPQAGLSFSPIVFEWYIGEGMSRYQALFYGDYPETVNNGSHGSPDPTDPQNGSIPPSDEVTLGPIRSGRLPFEYVRNLYNGFLIMASAYKGVANNLNEFTNVFGSDDGDINSAMIKVTQIENIAENNQKKLGDTSLSGMLFDPVAPQGGAPASRLWFMYNILNQVIWQYDETDGAYHRYQYTGDDRNQFIEDTDRLNGNPLTYSNLIILYAEHRYCTETAYDVDLMYVNRAPALLFRDGQVYKIYWTTKSEDYEKTTGKVRPIRFMDEQGNPFPFKPGQTWIHVVPLGTRVWETRPSDVVDSMIYDQVKKEPSVLFDNIRYEGVGSGEWATRYLASLMIEDKDVCTKIRGQ
ncbi:MAG: DUF3048 C-terminal domain-containing protein [Anaerolineae bacterium]|nr:DUF3048 C-terminal domain-containing protein [Anaerolineae bacterium]